MQIKIRDVLTGVLHSVVSSTDFHPHEGREPEIWDEYVPSWAITRYEQSYYTDDAGRDRLMIVLGWRATLLFPNGNSREVLTTYTFESDFFADHYGIRGLIMNFHEHVSKALQLSIVPKE